MILLGVTACLAAIVLRWIALQHSWNAAIFLQGVVAVFGGLLFLISYDTRSDETSSQTPVQTKVSLKVFAIALI